MSDERRAEHGLACPHELQSDTFALKHRLGRLLRNGRGGAVDMQTVLVRRNDASLEYDSIYFDLGHPA